MNTTASRTADLRLQVDGAVATITIDRPSKRNSLCLATWLAMPGVVAAADRDPAVRVVLVRGAGEHFSAGNDIAELAALRGNPHAAEAFGMAMARAAEAVEDAAKPVLMVIEGHCYGAAVALALAGDLRIAAADAAFAITPAKLGAVYLASDLDRLVRAIGQGASKRLLYSAEAIGAAEARAIGLVDEVLSTGDFAGELDRLVAAVAAMSPRTLVHTKRMLRDAGAGPGLRETGETLVPFVEATQSRDFAEGAAAFLERRQPAFEQAAPLAPGQG